MNQYEVVIVGGGLVGASLACLLAKLQIKVALVEAQPLKSDALPHYDERVIALSYGSRMIFGALGVWEELAKEAAPIEHIHVSQQGTFGTAHLRCEDVLAEALGYVIPARVIGQALANQLCALPQLTLLTPATLQRLQVEPEAVTLEVDSQGLVETLSCSLLIAADGAHSRVRESMGWPAQHHEYQQYAVTCNVTFAKAHQHTAYERFSQTGPMAMLPLSGRQMACVWTVPEAEMAAVQVMSDGEFAAQLQSRFGYRLGSIERVGRRSVFWLTQTRVKQFVGDKVVLIGNAAHAMHPVAGQGFNLGLRDAHELYRLLGQQQGSALPLNSAAMLQQYRHQREQDHRWVMGATDSLIKVFAWPGMPSRWLRALALLGLDSVAPLKNGLTRYAMGLK